MIDELVSEAFSQRKLLIKQIKEIFFKIEDEIRELGVPMVLPAFPNSNFNLPKQLKISQNLVDEMEKMKFSMIKEKEKLYKSCYEMYKEEQESGITIESNNVNSENELPNWIHELFSSVPVEDSSFTSFTSATTAAIDQLDPFVLSLSDSLAKLEAAHKTLTARLEIFKAEFDILWREIGESYAKLYPFDETEITDEMSGIIVSLSDGTISNRAISVQNGFTRSNLRKIALEWKRIEKDRSESISGSILLIGRLWNLLETPQEEQFQLSPSNLSISNMKILSQERCRLINFQQQKFKELYDSQVQELKKIMAALKWSQCKQDSLLSSCQCYTADGLQFLSIQLAALQPKLELSLEIINFINSRLNLIAKMREFEKSASDPSRLFRSSFQLLQEEKFRKTALPNLLNLESQLKTLLTGYHAKFAEEFIYYSDSDIENCPPYIQVLEDEISGRFMSSGIFGFDQSKQRKERQSSIPQANTPRYTTSNSNGSNRKQSGTSSPPSAVNVIPQRRKLDK